MIWPIRASLTDNEGSIGLGGEQSLVQEVIKKLLQLRRALFGVHIILAQQSVAQLIKALGCRQLAIRSRLLH